MSSPVFDFSHLTPEVRIQLAEELWDTQPWREVLDDIEQRGA
jgi:hypothetical protein